MNGKSGLVIGLFSASLFLAGCADPRYAKGTLLISYQLNETEGVIPSYQTAIWLEDESGSIRSLMVTQYLSFGGYKDERTCPDWSSRSQWDQQPYNVLNAVTRATPPLKANTLRVSCQKAGLEPGAYAYHVETHLDEQYNILASGRIRIGDESESSTAAITHKPEKHRRGATALSNVTAEYKP